MNINLNDFKVSNDELKLVSTYVHRYMVNKSAEEHNNLANMDPVKYIYCITDIFLKDNPCCEV